MKPAFPPGRRGISLVEVLFASAILAVFVVTFLNTYFVTSRQASSSEALLNTGLLAQTVIERIKSKVAMNPRFFRDLMGGSPQWTFTGTVIDPASAVNPDGLKLSPFFEYLFARSNPELCTDANQITIAAVTQATPTGLKPEALKSMIDTFAPFQVTVTISNDVDISSPGANTAFAETLKRIVVQVARSRIVAEQGADPLTFTVTARVIAPEESLSPDALRAISARFGSKPLEEQWRDVFLASGSNPYLDRPELSQDSRNLLADAFLILEGANNEALLTDGRTATVPNSTIVDASKEAEFLEAWVQRFSAPGVQDASSSRCELAKLYSRKATVVFDAYKRVRSPMRHLIEQIVGNSSEEKNVVARVRESRTRLAAIIAASNAKSKSKKGKRKRKRSPINMKLVELALPDYVLCSYLQQFFLDPAYSRVILRPAAYPLRFQTAIDDMARVLEQHLEQKDGVTAHRRMVSAQLLMEIGKVRLLYSAPGTPLDPVLAASLKQFSNENSRKVSDLTRYLTSGELYDRAALTTRHQEFAQRAAEMRITTAQFESLVGLFLPGGDIAVFMSDYRRFFSELQMDSASLLTALTQIQKGQRLQGGEL